MTQKLPSCQHGVVGECNSCSLLKAFAQDIDKRIVEEEYPLEIRLHKMQESIDCLFTCIKGIEGREGIRSLQFHAEFGKRLATIEDLFAEKSFKPIHDAMELHVERFNERISTLENHVCFNKDNRHDLNQSLKAIQHDYKREIDSLEKTVASLVDKIAEIANFYYREKTTPHKCPVCEGAGKLWPKDMLGYNLCHPCEGKGVLWK